MTKLRHRYTATPASAKASADIRLAGRYTATLLRCLIHLYRFTLSPFLGRQCRFLPTCSQYALDAIALYGPYRGSILALKRIGRCHPWGSHGFDPVKKEDS